MTDGVLFLDMQGPAAARRAFVISAVATVALVAVLGWVVSQLYAKGQLSATLWGPIIDPANAQFGPFWRFLGTGLRNTLTAAVVSVSAALVLGTLVSTIYFYAGRVVRPTLAILIELFRGIPVVILIFGVAVVLPENGILLSPFWYMCIAISAHGAAMIAEILRAGIASLPLGQHDAGYAIGLSKHKLLALILYPQSFRVMLPALISQMILTLKDTTLGFIISFPDFLRNAEVAIQNLGNPIQVYFVVAVVFIGLNLGLSRLAIRMERHAFDSGLGNRNGPRMAPRTSRSSSTVARRVDARVPRSAACSPRAKAAPIPGSVRSIRSHG
jgi:glutamate transport system permease protein